MLAAGLHLSVGRSLANVIFTSWSAQVIAPRTALADYEMLLLSDVTV